MPRNFYEATLGSPDLAGVWKVYSGIRVTVYNRGTTDLATIYQRETGVTAGPSPEAGATGGPNPFITGSTGSVQFWADLGRYDILIEDTVVPIRIGSRTIQWNSVAMDEIPGSSLADLAVATAKLDDLAVVAGKIATDAVTTPKLVDLSVTTGKLGAAQVTSPKIEAQSAWTLATMATGTYTWTQYPGHGNPGSAPDVAYMKDSLGFVHLRGGCVPNIALSNGSLFFTLPTGYRPGVNQLGFGVWHFIGGQSAREVPSMIAIRSNGWVEFGYNPGAWPAGNGISFDGISFRAEN
jgi:hypothetical protein